MTHDRTQGPPPPAALGAVDLAFRQAAGRPLVMGVLADFPAGLPVAEVRARAAERAARIPSLSYRDAGDGRTLLPAADFTPEQHLREADLARDEDGSATGRLLLARPLPEGRPLWDLWLIRRPGGAHTVCLRSDHALRDGAAAVRILRTLLADDDPGPHPRPQPRRRPGPAGFATATGQALRAVRSPGVAPAFAGTPAGTQGMFHLDTGADRLRRAAHAHGATVNDVYLAALSEAVGRWYEKRAGAAHPPLPVSMPMSVRAPGEESRVGNAVVTARLTLPCGHSDGARHALRVVAAQTGRLRRTRYRHAAHRLLRAMPAALGARTARHLADAAAVTTITSAIDAGPALRVAGRPSARAGMFTALAAGLRCYTALTTHHDTARLTVVHDDALPGVHDLGTHWRAALDDLLVP